MNPDYLPTLRERFGDDAGTRAPDPLDDWDHWANEPHDLPPMPAACGAYCLCDGGDPCEATTATDDAGEWLGTRRVETVEIPGVNQLPPWDPDEGGQVSPGPNAGNTVSGAAGIPLRNAGSSGME